MQVDYGPVTAHAYFRSEKKNKTSSVMYYLSVVVRTEKHIGTLSDLDCLARVASVS